MNLNSLPSENIAIVGVIDPDAYAAGTEITAYVDLGKFEQAMAIVFVGDMVTNSTVAAKLVQATDSGGTGKKDITGKAITTLTEAGTDDNKQAIVNVRAEELDVKNGFAFAALEMTTAVAASDSGGVLLACGARHGPANAHDLASVDEIVA